MEHSTPGLGSMRTAGGCDVRCFTVALAGNPNSGKTTIFNRLTGARQHVGNYPGVTVEWKQGVRRTPSAELRFVDLPGTYSLTPFSDEELVARDYLLNGGADLIVDVVDAGSLERNLYLTTELLELGLPVVVALNMSDVAVGRGIAIDTEKLGKRLGVPVVATVGHNGQGLQELLSAVLETAFRSADENRVERLPRVDFGPMVEPRIDRLVGLLDRLDGRAPPPRQRRWHAVKLLERDGAAFAALNGGKTGTAPAVADEISGIAAELDHEGRGTSDITVSRARYAYIAKVCRGAIRNGRPRALDPSDRIDRFALHSFWGVPIFLALMFLVFNLTFTLGQPLMLFMEAGVGAVGAGLSSLWPAGSDSPLRALLVEGIVGGVGGVLVFLPNIVLLFLAIALLEGSGYMARAAFVMDRFMSRVGLHGKSFIPLLIGFGCTVPAIMATRTLETRRDRLITMLVLPLMSCGARLPIYALIIPAFFPPRWQGPMLWGLYVTGIVLALCGARLLRQSIFRGETTPFLMELPPFRLPDPVGLLVQVWTRAWLYLKKAGTVILGVSIILWALTSYPKPPPEWVPPSASDASTVAVEAAGDDSYAIDRDDAAGFGRSQSAVDSATAMAYSVAGRVGRMLEPVLAPMGFDWRIGTALIGAFAAKEVFVAQMGIVFAVGTEDENTEALRQQLHAHYPPLVGLCIMLFCLIATPCMATVAVTRQESGSWRWAFLQFWGLTLLAWILTTAVYQAGRLGGVV
jgi:ferrous iron transport protein B